MENLDNPVKEVAETVEGAAEQITKQTSEQPEAQGKTYTQEELDQIVERKVAGREARIRKEYNGKYGRLENVLKAGTGKDNVEEITDVFRQFYEDKGVKIPSEPAYCDRDIEILARAEADDIIRAGLEEVTQEVDRLADVGLANMSPREKAVFKTLAEYRQNAERGRELSKIGVTEEVYGSKEFKDFAGKFSSATPITEVYEIYNKMKPKKEITLPGSMKNTATQDIGVKDFYTVEEARRFTKKDFDRNPALLKSVENSMLKWKR